MPSYVPPHLRSKAANIGAPTPQLETYPESFTPGEIHDYFWGEEQAANDETGRFSNTGSLTRTLHDSRKTAGKLAFVFLFQGANPRWDADQIVFTKSNLELLPSGKPGDHATEDVEKLKEEVGGEGAPLAESGETQDAEEPIAVFKQAGASKFIFEGWYRIGLIDFLEPQSPELMRMLEQKWTRSKGRRTFQQERSIEKWQQSLALRWAVIKFVKAETRGPPAIEHKPDSPLEPKKSVNEMLADLRVNDISRKDEKGVQATSDATTEADERTIADA